LSRSLLPPALAATGLVVAIDQVSKQIAVSHFEYSRNEGIAFGLGGDVSTWVIAGELVFLAVLLYFLTTTSRIDRMIWVATALLVGGALGNLADRARDGSVIDFIDVPLWPTFNLADVAIVAGVILLVLGVGRAEREPAPP
jgi:signal peptidase II